MYPKRVWTSCFGAHFTLFRICRSCRVVMIMVVILFQNLGTMLIKTPDLIEAMIELACSRRWLQSTIYVIEFSQHVVQGLWLKDNSLRQVGGQPATVRSVDWLVVLSVLENTCGRLGLLLLYVCIKGSRIKVKLSISSRALVFAGCWSKSPSRWCFFWCLIFWYFGILVTIEGALTGFVPCSLTSRHGVSYSVPPLPVGSHAERTIELQLLRGRSDGLTRPRLPFPVPKVTRFVVPRYQRYVRLLLFFFFLWL